MRAETAEEASSILHEALEHDHKNFMKLASRFGADYGRLPDNLHAAVLLTGGEMSKEYLSNIAGKMEKQGV